MRRHVMMRTLCLVIACFVMSATVTAGQVVVHGKYLRFTFDPPVVPASRSECDEFQTQSEAVIQEISAAHEECLAANSGTGDSGGSGPNACSVPTCQVLHTARTTSRGSLDAAVLKCRADVWERLASESRRGGSASAAAEADLQMIGEKLAAGPLAAVRSYAKGQLSAAASEVFGVSGGTAKVLINGAWAAALMADRGLALQNACLAAKKTDVSHVCSEEIYGFAKSVGSLAPLLLKSDPAIGLIQKAMFARIYLIQDETMRQLRSLDNLDRAGGGVTQSSPLQRPLAAQPAASDAAGAPSETSGCSVFKDDAASRKLMERDSARWLLLYEKCAK